MVGVSIYQLSLHARVTSAALTTRSVPDLFHWQVSGTNGVLYVGKIIDQPSFCRQSKYRHTDGGRSARTETDDQTDDEQMSRHGQADESDFAWSWPVWLRSLRMLAVALFWLTHFHSFHPHRFPLTAPPSHARPMKLGILYTTTLSRILRLLQHADLYPCATNCAPPLLCRRLEQSTRIFSQGLPRGCYSMVTWRICPSRTPAHTANWA